MTVGGDDRTYFGNPVLQIDKKTLKVLKKYESVKDATNETQILGISSVIYNDVISSGGYYWVLEKDYFPGWKPRKDKNKLRERPILCIEKSIIYDNCAIAAKKNNVSTSAINAVLKRKHPTCIHCHWCYADEYNEDYILRIDNRGWNKRKILRVNDQKVFDSITDAANEIGVSPSTILDTLTKRSNTAGGYYWCYLEDKDSFVKPKNKHYRKVLCIETGKIYEKIRDAMNDTGANETKINAVCKGVRKTAGGFHWKYIDQ